MTSMNDVAWPVMFRCFCMGDLDECMCLPMERALRAWKLKEPTVPPMTPDQREACLREIEQVEGYSRADYVDAHDGMLASGVLDAWTDYCRDKGLI